MNNNSDIAIYYGCKEIAKKEVKWFFRPEKVCEQVNTLARWESDRDFLHDRTKWTEEKLKAFQIHRLALLVDFAYSTVPFYNELYSQIGYRLGEMRALSDFEKLPIITKQDIQDNFESLISTEFNPKTCRWFTSTGSSGKPLQLIMQPERAEIDTLYRMRMFEMMFDGKLESDRWLYNINHATWWHSSLVGKYRTFTVSQSCEPDELIRHIKCMQPAIISVTASALDLLSKSKPDFSLSGVSCISTNSETSTKMHRTRWESIFKVPVRDEYSSEELGLIGYECAKGNYHFTEDDSYIELRHSSNDEFEVIGTDLWNFAMPIIRYEQGDQVEIKNTQSKCGCGSNFRMFKRVLGRNDDSFIDVNNQRVSTSILLELAELYLASDESGLDEFRVVQKSLNEIIIYINSNSKVSNDIIDQFSQSLNKLLGNDCRYRMEPMVNFDIKELNKRKIFHQFIK